MKLLIYYLFFMLALSAFAFAEDASTAASLESDAQDLRSEFKEEIGSILEGIDLINRNFPCEVIKRNRDLSPRCQRLYDNLFAKGTLDVRMFFGYLDNDDAEDEFVSDKAEKDAILDQLLSPCTSSHSACGFERRSSDSDRIYKTFKNPKGEEIGMVITLRDTAVTDYRDLNSTTYREQQKEKSKKITEEFLSSLDEADVVLYNGHSRHGTGPGFIPLPKYKKDWWKAGILQPMRVKMIKTLKKSSHKPKLIGLLSCQTSRYYGKQLKEAAPQSGLLLSKIPTDSENTSTAILATIDSIITHKCEIDFERSLGIYSKGAYELQNFFQ